ncbi:MAG: hypothetical protein JZU55_02575 [Afipia sp.]|nr:hypothetical protein [Afipia sp.]
MVSIPPDDATDVQKAFWKGLTDQRVANMWAAADDWADLSPEAKEFLRRADKKKIQQLNSHMEFMNAAGIVWKFLWVGGATIFAMFVGITQLWDWISKHIKITGIK